MKSRADEFEALVREALADKQLRTALSGLRTGLVSQRQIAYESLPQFEAYRTKARDIRDHTLANLDTYLEAYERNAKAAGANVHWAPTAADARTIVLNICKQAGAQLVAKGKSMISEEIGLNECLAAEGIEVVETDLGEYLVQLRGEAPSHIIAPAIHLTPGQVADDFREHHHDLPPQRVLAEPSDMVGEARAVLRRTFAAANVGITGANFIVAETGSSLIVTNEGNGDLVQSLAKVHVVLASIEKVVPTLADASMLLRVLARSATGQNCTTYTTLSTGPKRADDLDGPSAYHVVLLDNGRSELLASEVREILRCIRCGACINHCPVYETIGGHAYGWVYPGPLGAVLTPGLKGVAATRHLPNASTFCGRCSEVCPVKIPLPDLMRNHREALFRMRANGTLEKLAMGLWGWLAERPGAYHLVARLVVGALGALGRSRGRFRWLPMAGGWCRHRDFPAPEGRTFQQLWNERQAGVRNDWP